MQELLDILDELDALRCLPHGSSDGLCDCDICLLGERLDDIRAELAE